MESDLREGGGVEHAVVEHVSQKICWDWEASDETKIGRSIDGREQRNPPLRRVARAVALSVVGSHSFFGPQTSPWPPHSSSQTQGVILKPRSHSLALGPFT